ncbi:UNKNOWN [Stylonychia lemnae]|uniref:Uncharacterized protein n=1 Tax=Stylonychia lemnae TaxID=5949 RepID=A0A078AR60_STYLE|nr:UNKNOWN [Stylonychia lemnae]|eukprot:CDW84895.1 UNKNOWN [Stylonychia lemnae]
MLEKIPESIDSSSQNSQFYQEYNNVLHGFERGSLSEAGRVQNMINMDEPEQIKQLILYRPDRDKQYPKQKNQKMQDQILKNFEKFEREVITDQKYLPLKQRSILKNAQIEGAQLSNISQPESQALLMIQNSSQDEQQVETNKFGLSRQDSLKVFHHWTQDRLEVKRQIRHFQKRAGFLKGQKEIVSQFQGQIKSKETRNRQLQMTLQSIAGQLKENDARLQEGLKLKIVQEYNELKIPEKIIKDTYSNQQLLTERVLSRERDRKTKYLDKMQFLSQYKNQITLLRRGTDQNNTHVNSSQKISPDVNMDFNKGNFENDFEDSESLYQDRSMQMQEIFEITQVPLNVQPIQKQQDKKMIMNQMRKADQEIKRMHILQKRQAALQKIEKHDSKQKTMESSPIQIHTIQPVKRAIPRGNSQKDLNSLVPINRKNQQVDLNQDLFIPQVIRTNSLSRLSSMNKSRSQVILAKYKVKMQKSIDYSRNNSQATFDEIGEKQNLIANYLKKVERNFKLPFSKQTQPKPKYENKRVLDRIKSTERLNVQQNPIQSQMNIQQIESTINLINAQKMSISYERPQQVVSMKSQRHQKPQDQQEIQRPSTYRKTSDYSVQDSQMVQTSNNTYDHDSNYWRRVYRYEWAVGKTRSSINLAQGSGAIEN